MSDFFLGRQPIVGRDRELVAYELLFRAGGRSAPAELDDVAATAAVIQHTLYDLGIEDALSGKLGLINVSQDLLMSNLIEALPHASVALEILETVNLTPEVAARCAQLKQAGFALALDDVVEVTDALRRVLPFVKIVKVDVLGIPQENMAALVGELKPYGVKLLAEKVETAAQFRHCHQLGFDLFQGYFFAEPAILTGKSVKTSTMALIKLTSLLAADADTELLEDVLKQAPDLILRLLRLANSFAFNPNSSKILNLRNAILVLGRAELGRLAQIMIFSEQSRLGLAMDPLVQLAASRGRMMEGMAKILGWPRMKESAFMVGMLSLADALFGVPIAEIARLFNLDDAMRDALCDHAGPLGKLLHLVKLSEREEADMEWELLEPLGAIAADQFNRLQVESLAWAGRL